MKREIKLQGLRIDGRGWVYGDLVQWKDLNRAAVIPQNGEEWRSPDEFEVRPETVGQFTGYTDIKGREVYEGDMDDEGNVVVCCQLCAAWQFGQEFDGDMVISCHNCEGHFMFHDHISRFEITGNIHEQ